MNSEPPEHRLTEIEDILRSETEKAIRDKECAARRYQWVITTICGLLLFFFGLLINTGNGAITAKQQIAVNTKRLDMLESRMDRFEAVQSELNNKVITVDAKLGWMLDNWPAPLKTGKYGD